MLILWRLVTSFVLVVCQLLVRMGLGQSLQLSERITPLPSGFKYWIHGASLGEIKALCGFWKSLGLREKILITCQTKTAYDWLCQQKLPQVTLRFFPLDHPSLFQQGLQSLEWLILFEGEIWPGLLRELREREKKLLWINPLKKSRILFEKWGGNTHLLEIPEEGKGPNGAPSYKMKLLSFTLKEKEREEPSAVCLFHCMRKEEWLTYQKAIRFLLSQGRSVVLAPRHLRELSFFKRKYHEFVDQVTWVEKMGGMENWFDKSALVVVGGGWSFRSLHNYLEPLAHSIPVVVGSWGGLDPLGEKLQNLDCLFVWEPRESFPLALIEKNFVKENLRKFALENEEARSTVIEFLRERIC